MCRRIVLSGACAVLLATICAAQATSTGGFSFNPDPAGLTGFGLVFQLGRLGLGIPIESASAPVVFDADWIVLQNLDFSLSEQGSLRGASRTTTRAWVASGGGTLGYGSQPVAAASLANGGLVAIRTGGAGITTSTLSPGGSQFQTAGQYSTGPTPEHVIAADFNGDGNADLAVSNFGSLSTNSGGNIQIFLGKGDGTFSAGSTLTAGATPVAMCAADLNGDGKPDLAVADVTKNGIYVLLGNGDGTFKSAVAYPAGQAPQSLVVADFNGDGQPDIAAANYSGTVSIFLGNGNGTFKSAVSYPGGSGRTTYLAWTDLNGDGKLDLIVANPDVNGIAFLFGNGDGSFQAPVAYVTGARPGFFALIPSADGAPLQIASVDGNSGDLMLLPVTPTGIAASPQLHILPHAAKSVAAGDLNGDGFPDMAVANGSVSILLRQPGAEFSAPVNYTLQSGSNATAVALGDFNGDGKKDVVTSGPGAQSSGTVDVALNNGNGTFGQQHSYPIGGNPGGSSNTQTSSGLVTGDLNGDGKLDVAAAFSQVSPSGSTTGGISVLLGNGDGTLRSAVNYSLGNFGPLCLVVGDFNGDGKLDLAAGVGLNFSPPGRLAILFGNGDGTFQSPTMIQVGSPAGTPIAFASGDLNADGKLDLIATVWDANLNPSIVVLLGNGDGTFRQLAPIIPPASGLALALADLNGDKIPDLVVADCCGLSESVYLLGNGDGTFQSPRYFSSGSSVESIAVADWNGDGTAGLALAQAVGTVMAMRSGISSKASTGAPQIRSVENAEGGAPTIAPNTWIEIDGSGLAPPGDTRTWQASDFVNNLLPKQLDGVSVTVNGKPAYVYYISPTQVNVLTPPDALPSGPVQVVVTNSGAASATFTAQAQSISPSFFIYGGTPYVAARHADQSLIGPASLYPGSSMPAKPGETIELYANGFGPTSQAVAAGSETQGGALSPTPVVSIGGATATVTFAGLVAPGLFQINATVPASLTDGDQPLSATYNASSTQSGVLLTVQH